LFQAPEIKTHDATPKIVSPLPLEACDTNAVKTTYVRGNGGLTGDVERGIVAQASGLWGGFWSGMESMLEEFDAPINDSSVDHENETIPALDSTPAAVGMASSPDPTHNQGIGMNAMPKHVAVDDRTPHDSSSIAVLEARVRQLVSQLQARDAEVVRLKSSINLFRSTYDRRMHEMRVDLEKSLVDCAVRLAVDDNHRTEGTEAAVDSASGVEPIEEETISIQTQLKDAQISIRDLERKLADVSKERDTARANEKKYYKYYLYIEKKKTEKERRAKEEQALGSASVEQKPPGVGNHWTE
jgi:hypothetical protein